MGKSTIVTIYDVASMARVSLATVSRVLNNPDKVNEDTRKIVLHVINKLGYKPNPIARSLATRKSTTVGIIISDISRSSVSQMIGGIIKISDEYGYSMKIYATNNCLNFHDLIKNILVDNVDGVIVLNDELDADNINYLFSTFCDSDIPVVFSNVTSINKNISTVNIDFLSAGYEATKNLISLSRKDILFVSTVRLYATNKDKEKGYIKAMEEAGLEPKIFRTSGDPEINCLHFSEFLNHNNVDGVICVRDSIALSFINVAKRKGLDIPNDISVIGMQNTKYAQLSYPTLSCVDVPVYQLGEESMKLLTQFMQGKIVDKKHILLPYNLILRESTEIM